MGEILFKAEIIPMIRKPVAESRTVRIATLWILMPEKRKTGLGFQAVITAPLPFALFILNRMPNKPADQPVLEVKDLVSIGKRIPKRKKIVKWNITTHHPDHNPGEIRIPFQAIGQFSEYNRPNISKPFASSKPHLDKKNCLLELVESGSHENAIGSYIKNVAGRGQ